MSIRQPTEADILRDCLRYLGMCPQVLAWRNNSGTLILPGEGGRPRRAVKMGTPGVADVVGLLEGGRCLLVEVKGPAGRLRPAQELFLSRARELGALCLVCRSVHELRDALRAEGYDVP